jgi:hypothetical protein
VAHITIEYVIMVPLLIAQIFLFPYVASIAMNSWVDSRRTLALEEVASHLGSSIQQTYLSLNYTTISAANVTNKLDVPLFIEGYAYTATAALRTGTASKVLELTLTFEGGVAISTIATVTLGQNVKWHDSTFVSNSINASLQAVKYSNKTIQLSFGS